MATWISKQRLIKLYTIKDSKCTCGKYTCEGRKPGKHPVDTHGVKDAKVQTTDFDKFNYGIACGNGLVVFDIDKKENINGYITLADLEKQLGILPPTVSVNTGSGGKHLYFNAKIRTQGIKGIDIRSDGSYVVIPPSKHWSGDDYEWDFNKSPEDIEIANLPQKWIEHFSDLKQENKEFVSLVDACSLAEAVDALNSIDPDIEYNTWFKLIAAARYTGISLDIVDKWCSKGKDYKKKEVAQKYNSAKKEDGVISRIGTIFHIAKQYGWNQFIPEMKLIFHKLPKKNIVFPDIPYDLFGKLVDSILKQSTIYDRNFAIGSAITSISAASLGGYLSCTNSTMGIYSLFIDYFGGGKKYYHSIPLKTLFYCNTEKRLDTPASNNAFIDYLSKYNVRAWIQDETIDKLITMFGGGGKVSEFSQDLPNTFLNLWSNNDQIAGISAKTKDAKIPYVKYPAFMFCGAGVTGDFRKLLSTPRAINSGLLSRILPLLPIESIEDETKLTQSSFNFTRNDIEKIKFIDAQCTRSIQTLPTVTILPSITVQINQEAEAAYLKIKSDIKKRKVTYTEEQKEDPKSEYAMDVRFYEQLGKLMSAHAIWNDPRNPIVTLEILHFWNHYLSFIKQQIMGEMAYFGGETKDALLEGRILRYITKNPGLTGRGVYWKLSINSKQFSPAIKELELRNLVILKDGKYFAE